MRQTVQSIVIALFAAGVLSGTAGATIVNPVIDWSGPESQAYEPGFVMPFTSTSGAQLTVVGKIQLFQAPLAGLNAADPTKEYTFVFDQLTSTGTVDNGATWKVVYNGGRFRIYEDANPNRNYGTNPPNATSPSTFLDGVLVLEGTFSNFITNSNKFNPGGNYNADLVCTGGREFPLVSCAGQGFTGYMQGVWNRTGALTGYIRSCDGKIDLFDCPVPVQGSTWGRVKTLINE